MPVVGIDIGSLTVEVVILEDHRVLHYQIASTGSNSRASAEKLLIESLRIAGINREDITYIVATGYGRIGFTAANNRITEITCHGKGAHFIDPAVRMVIDIGGQDSKVIRLNEAGRVLDFAMNDKCAAGTGRFLEVMSQTLEVKIDELSALSEQAVSTVPISSTCTVFAESEVVSLIAQGLPREDIARSLHLSIADRTAGLVNRVGLQEPVMFTGGVAKNRAVASALSEKLKVRLIVPPEPQIVGALGAALLAAGEA